MRVPLFIQRWLLRQQAKGCFNVAMRICLMGFDNREAQRHLDAAKDELYTAASKFRERENSLKL